MVSDDAKGCSFGQVWTHSRRLRPPGSQRRPTREQTREGQNYSAFTKEGNPSKLMILLQGGGACWQGFYFCNILAEDQAPPPPPVGVWSDLLYLQEANGTPLDVWLDDYLRRSHQWKDIVEDFVPIP